MKNKYFRNLSQG